jgi:hypothetical protein
MAAKHMNSERIFKPVATHGHSASIDVNIVINPVKLKKYLN